MNLRGPFSSFTGFGAGFDGVTDVARGLGFVPLFAPFAGVTDVTVGFFGAVPFGGVFDAVFDTLFVRAAVPVLPPPAGFFDPDDPFEADAVFVPLLPDPAFAPDAVFVPLLPFDPEAVFDPPLAPVLFFPPVDP